MNDWGFWAEKHRAVLQPVYPERIRAMWSEYGKTPGKTCKTCKNLVRLRYNRTYLKCALTNWTNGAATDWRAGWEACGKYEEEPGND